MSKLNANNVKTVALHTIIVFLSTFSAVLSAAKLGSNVHAWPAVITAAAASGVTSVTTYLSGILSLEPKTPKA
jgi:hypothetical protein